MGLSSVSVIIKFLFYLPTLKRNNGEREMLNLADDLTDKFVPADQIQQIYLRQMIW
jgi:hypothetical protein